MFMLQTQVIRHDLIANLSQLQLTRQRKYCHFRVGHRAGAATFDSECNDEFSLTPCHSLYGCVAVFHLVVLAAQNAAASPQDPPGWPGIGETQRDTASRAAPGVSAKD